MAAFYLENTREKNKEKAERNESYRPGVKLFESPMLALASCEHARFVMLKLRFISGEGLRGRSLQSRASCVWGLGKSSTYFDEESSFGFFFFLVFFPFIFRKLELFHADFSDKFRDNGIQRFILSQVHGPSPYVRQALSCLD